MADGKAMAEGRLKRAVRAGRLEEDKADRLIKVGRVERARDAKRRVRALERAEAERRLAALIAGTEA